MPDVRWQRTGVGYKDGKAVHTSTGIKVGVLQDRITLAPFRLASVTGGVRIEVPVAQLDEFINALYEAKSQFEQAKPEVRRRLSRLK